MDINTVCTLLIDALKGAGYNDSTIFNYQGAVRRFKAFCEKHNVTDMTMKSAGSMLKLWSAPKLESLARSVIIFKAALSGLLIRISAPASLIFRLLQDQEYTQKKSIIARSTRITAHI